MPAFSTRSICRVSCVTVSGSAALLPGPAADGAAGSGAAEAAGRRRVTCAWKSKKLLEDIGREYNAALMIVQASARSCHPERQRRTSRPSDAWREKQQPSAWNERPFGV